MNGAEASSLDFGHDLMQLLAFCGIRFGSLLAMGGVGANHKRRFDNSKDRATATASSNISQRLNDDSKTSPKAARENSNQGDFGLEAFRRQAGYFDPTTASNIDSVLSAFSHGNTAAITPDFLSKYTTALNENSSGYQEANQSLRDELNDMNQAQEHSHLNVPSSNTPQVSSQAASYPEGSDQQSSGVSSLVNPGTRFLNDFPSEMIPQYDIQNNVANTDFQKPSELPPLHGGDIQSNINNIVAASDQGDSTLFQSRSKNPTATMDQIRMMDLNAQQASDLPLKFSMSMNEVRDYWASVSARNGREEVPQMLNNLDVSYSIPSFKKEQGESHAPIQNAPQPVMHLEHSSLPVRKIDDIFKAFSEARGRPNVMDGDMEVFKNISSQSVPIPVPSVHNPNMEDRRSNLMADILKGSHQNQSSSDSSYSSPSPTSTMGSSPPSVGKKANNQEAAHHNTSNGMATTAAIPNVHNGVAQPGIFANSTSMPGAPQEFISGVPGLPQSIANNIAMSLPRQPTHADFAQNPSYVMGTNLQDQYNENNDAQTNKAEQMSVALSSKPDQFGGFEYDFQNIIGGQFRGDSPAIWDFSQQVPNAVPNGLFARQNTFSVPSSMPDIPVRDIIRMGILAQRTNVPAKAEGEEKQAQSQAQSQVKYRNLLAALLPNALTSSPPLDCLSATDFFTTYSGPYMVLSRKDLIEASHSYIESCNNDPYSTQNQLMSQPLNPVYMEFSERYFRHSLTSVLHFYVRGNKDELERFFHGEFFANEQFYITRVLTALKMGISVNKSKWFGKVDDDKQYPGFWGPAKIEEVLYDNKAKAEEVLNKGKLSRDKVSIKVDEHSLIEKFTSITVCLGTVPRVRAAAAEKEIKRILGLL